MRDPAAQALPGNLVHVARQLRLEHRVLHELGKSHEGPEGRAQMQALVDDESLLRDLGIDAAILAGAQRTTQVQHHR
jgi:hypothetical protein